MLIRTGAAGERHSGTGAGSWMRTATRTITSVFAAARQWSESKTGTYILLSVRFTKVIPYRDAGDGLVVGKVFGQKNGVFALYSCLNDHGIPEGNVVVESIERIQEGFMRNKLVFLVFCWVSSTSAARLPKSR